MEIKAPPIQSIWKCECHNQPVLTHLGDEGTNHFYCSITKEPCTAITNQAYTNMSPSNYYSQPFKQYKHSLLSRIIAWIFKR